MYEAARAQGTQEFETPSYCSTSRNDFGAAMLVLRVRVRELKPGRLAEPPAEGQGPRGQAFGAPGDAAGPVSAAGRPLLHAQTRLLPPGHQARQPAVRPGRRQPEDRRLRPREGDPRQTPLHRVRLHALVPRPRSAAARHQLLEPHRHVRHGVHHGRTHDPEAAVSRVVGGGPDLQDLQRAREPHHAHVAGRDQTRRGHELSVSAVRAHPFEPADPQCEP
mmetsp:Transcript_17627/g.36079  ORF Transcript_17627/g.36079 Transcript_17627/m.36079 type:complete len:220 (+) Transcript_17627:155-814(+)